MRLAVSHLIEGSLTSKRPVITLAVVLAAALFMLTGMAGRIVDTHDSFVSSDRLAAVSLILSGVPNGALPVTLLDVDDQTRASWNAQGATPHTALAELVRLSSGGGPAATLLDFDLSMDIAGAPGDPALLSLLSAYPADAPMLMLVRKIGFVRSTGTAENGPSLTASATPTPYDAATAGKANIRWVTTLNEIGQDRVVRAIRMWQSVCDGASGTVYPSAALVAAGYLAPGGENSAGLDRFLESRAAAECGASEPPSLPWPRVQKQAALLPYVLTGDPNAKVAMRIAGPEGPAVALRRISAGNLVTFANGKAGLVDEVDRDPFAGRVVIIGASYTESSDVHETPLGTMPGSMILANSIVQADRLTSVAPAAPALRNVIALLVFLIFAAFARYLIGVAAVLGIGLVSLGILIALSRLYGVETGFEVVAAAITGFSLFKLFDALAQMAGDIPKRGWRVILK
jgi:CHASE2 domain-containing sensor protein